MFGPIARSRLSQLIPRTGSYCKTAFTRPFSSSQIKWNDRVYELRTYNVKPKDTKLVLADLEKWIHVRTAYSKLVGFWLSEIGGMNDLLHLWEYDNLGHRAEIRQSLGMDKVWQGEFISKMLPSLLRQDNCVVKCLPGTSLSWPQGTGVYEIQNFSFAEVDLESLGRSMAQMNRPGALLVGSFYSIVGDLSSGFLLWQHSDLKNFEQDWRSLQKIKGVKFGHSRILLPTAFSEMK